MNYSSLEDIFDAFNHQRILIIGDVMLDSYVWGSVERISPEAPVPVVKVKKKENRMGGAANVARNILSLGAEPVLCSIIGNDPEGKYFRDLLNKQNITDEGIVISDARKTTTKERILSGSQHILRVDDEQEHGLLREEKANLKKKIKKLLPSVHAVVFEDYDKGTLDRDIIKFTVEMANDLDIPSIVDPKRKNFLAYKDVTLFKPNLKEIKEGLKIDLEKHDIDGLNKAIQELKIKLRAENILVTLSELGLYLSTGKKNYQISAHIRTISDVSGAGDTVIGIAALCMSLDLPPELLAALSNLGGGLVCEHLGVVPVDRNRLLHEAKLNKIL